MIARLGIQSEAAISQWQPVIVVPHLMVSAMPAGFGVHEIAAAIDIDPSMFQFIEMLYIPIPPDGIFNDEINLVA